MHAESEEGEGRIGGCVRALPAMCTAGRGGGAPFVAQSGGEDRVAPREMLFFPPRQRVERTTRRALCVRAYMRVYVVQSQADSGGGEENYYSDEEEQTETQRRGGRLNERSWEKIYHVMKNRSSRMRGGVAGARRYINSSRICESAAYTRRFNNLMRRHICTCTCL